VRFLLKVNIPVESGQAAKKAGKLGPTIQSKLENTVRYLGSKSMTLWKWLNKLKRDLAEFGSSRFVRVQSVSKRLS
jgi:hypothetical protein